MSVETKDQAEFNRYLEWQRAQRPQRIETLGGAATAIVLATVDMGTSGVRDPESAPHTSGRESQQEPFGAEVTSLRLARERRLAEFAAESAELGYARAV